MNGGLDGKIYLDGHSWYKSIDIATGQRQDVYWMDTGSWATPRIDGNEFVVGANTTISGNYYLNEDIVFFNRDGQEIDRQMIDGEVRGIVKVSPNGRYFAFDWFKDAENNGLMVLDRNSSWGRNFGPINGRGFDWTSSGRLVFSLGNKIYKVDDVSMSAPEIIAAIASDTWTYVSGLSVSYDEKKIAFWLKADSYYSGHIFMVGMDGSDPHQVTTSSEWERYVAWSPDSQHLAVVRGDFSTNIPDSYWSSDNGLGNTVPMLYVIDADARSVDLSADEPADAVTIKEVKDDGSIGYVFPDSPIVWQAR